MFYPLRWFFRSSCSFNRGLKHLVCWFMRNCKSFFISYYPGRILSSHIYLACSGAAQTQRFQFEIKTLRDTLSITLTSQQLRMIGCSWANWLNAHVWVRPIICLSCQFPVFLSNSLDPAGRPACPEEHFPFPHGAPRRKEGGLQRSRWGSDLIWPIAQVSELLTGSIQT